MAQLIQSTLSLIAYRCNQPHFHTVNRTGAIPEVAIASSAQLRGVDANGEYTLGYFIARSLNLGGLDLQQVPMAVVGETVIGLKVRAVSLVEIFLRILLSL